MDEETLTNLIRDLILEAAPEQARELEVLWEKYRPQFAHAADKIGFEIGGGPWGLIPFTPRTMGQIWILGFVAWRALEAYCPYILLCSEIAPCAMSNVPGQAAADKALEDELGKVEELRTIPNIKSFVWPSHIPEPASAPPSEVRERAIVDSVKIAAAYVFLHELRHVMFDEGSRPTDVKDEEIECDRYARDFLLRKIPDYSVSTGYAEEAVMNKRLIGLALGGFVLVEITPKRKRAGSATHPPIASRLRELVQKSSISVRASMWVYACCLLMSVLRREGKLPPTLTFADPADLFERLVLLL